MDSYSRPLVRGSSARAEKAWRTVKGAVYGAAAFKEARPIKFERFENNKSHEEFFKFRNTLHNKMQELYTSYQSRNVINPDFQDKYGEFDRAFRALGEKYDNIYKRRIALFKGKLTDELITGVNALAKIVEDANRFLIRGQRAL